MRDELLAITIRVAGEPQRSASTITTVGAYVVVVATALPQLTLTSVYVGDIGADSSATQLRLAPGRQAELAQRLLAGQQPGTPTPAAACSTTADLQALLAELADATRHDRRLPEPLKRAARAWHATDGVRDDDAS